MPNFTCKTGTYSLRFLFSLILIFAGAGISFAQKTIVNGKVYDAKTKEPIPFVNISFKDAKVGATTDIDGNYSIETYYATDSLICSSVGYKPARKKVKRDVSQTIDFALEEGSVSLGEVIIKAKEVEDPAHVLLKRIIENKPINNREKLDAYEYEVYNKIQFDLNNFGDKFTKRKLFKDFDFIFEHIDSTSEKVSLPFFLTETLSHFYYSRNPKGKKEVIAASKVSGINNESISQFLGQMYQDVNVYNNSLSIFGKNFVSPIADYALVYYNYSLVDSAYIDDKWCYHMEFEPKNKSELVFKGEFWVNDSTYAIKEIVGDIAEDANINFVSHLKVRHQYDEVEKEVWMLNKEELIIDFSLADSVAGFYGRKTTTYRDFVINQPKPPEFYSGAESVIVESVVNEKGDDYWQQVRHENISEKQQGIYQMVDSLKSTPRFLTYVDLVNFLFTGYIVKGKIEIGPVFTFLSYNHVEGLRPKFGLRTSNDFSKRVLLEGYAAYGLKDEQFKYMLGGQMFLSKKPRQILGVYYSEDMELTGQIPNVFPRDHFVQSITTRGPQNRLTFTKKGRIFIDREWFSGFSTKLQFSRSELQPRGDWSYERYKGDANTAENVKNLISTEISLSARFAFRETFLSGEFERISLGTKWPIFEAKIDFGIKGVLNSQYEYQKVTVSVKDQTPLGPFGNIEYKVEAGKVFQPLPYPLLFLHPGNESLFMNTESFNTLNFFEFVSDEYVSAKLEYHLEGFFLNKIPFFKKLKWREIVGVNGFYGRYNEANSDELILPEQTFRMGNKPFAEAYVGIENIFRVFRVDAIWRLTYLDRPNAPKFGILIGFDLQF